nr:MAG TPA: YopX protein [Caudoviricetes sp.]
MIPKFRAWLPDPDVKKMLRVKALIFENDKTRCMCGYAYDFYLEDEDAILMQSTGLKDKNGKEIFEGDIIRYNIDVVDIKRHPTLGFYTVLDGREGFFGDGMSIDDFEEGAKEFSKTAEIIGNIYENPELLEDN